MTYSELCSSSRPLSKNERNQKARQIPGTCQRARKAVKHGSDSDTNHS